MLGQKGAYTRCTILSLLVPIFVHGLYDFLAMWNNQFAHYGLYVLIVLLYIIAIRLTSAMSAADKRGSFYPRARVINYDTQIE